MMKRSYSIKLIQTRPLKKVYNVIKSKLIILFYLNIYFYFILITSSVVLIDHCYFV